MSAHTFAVTIRDILVSFSSTRKSKKEEKNQTIGINGMLWWNPKKVFKIEAIQFAL
jgi:hypothetical protein